MSDAASAKPTISNLQREIVSVVLDMIIPADPLRNKPSATDVSVLEYIIKRHPNTLARTAEELTELQNQAQSERQSDFLALSRESQDALVAAMRSKNPRFLMTLAVQATEAYYLDERVMSSIGMPSRPPYPEGYTVEPRVNEFLLEPVRARGSIWRRTEIEQKTDV
ncbi:MAG: gluconate 2-dehydrogenase subunit 3 family protein [Gammaproteobacteria bacterium]|nr:gluconate 2-dehydrogenase subunit 3 family protein [Gammaproteobacteria bacterium]